MTTATSEAMTEWLLSLPPVLDPAVVQPVYNTARWRSTWQPRR